ncbi:MAG TPA: 2-C-methyl-D-erythritol 4-phosphate cytidylyltransferase [Chitinophagaceae bacterium]|nr:2-C-methyl-D-erythritol 4-phosphate cytidylyltransferase [Chitinophagaceae bacterium]
MRKFAVIVAGGSGSRMGYDTPKQFLLINDKPVLVHTLLAFTEAYRDISIILVLPVNHMETGKQILGHHLPQLNVQFAEGGSTRFESVKNGINLAGDDSVIFVHDAVRCLVSVSLIRGCFELALRAGSAIPVVPLKDSIRRVFPGGSEVVNREELRAVQTPQTFRSEILKQAFQQPYRDGFTDEATVVEFAGGSVELIDGEESNIKITYPSDLLLAEQYLRQKK